MNSTFVSVNSVAIKVFLLLCAKYFNVINMVSTKYVTPLLEVVVLEVEAAILTASGENSFPHFGE